MRYRILLFDVDNTLLDFDANEEEAFKAVMKEMDQAWSEELFETYKELNTDLWKRIERNEVTVEQGVNRRLSDLMAKYGKAVDGVLWEKTYRKYLNLGIQEIPQAHQVLRRLEESGHELYVITNGVTKTQESRMARSGLDQYFREMFISGRIGAGKPSGEFFDYVKSHVPGFEEKEALVIGDSLSSDIRGGADAGIPTCWFTRNADAAARDRALEESGAKPDYIIGSLPEIFRFV